MRRLRHWEGGPAAWVRGWRTLLAAEACIVSVVFLTRRWLRIALLSIPSGGAYSLPCVIQASCAAAHISALAPAIFDSQVTKPAHARILPINSSCTHCKRRMQGCLRRQCSHHRSMRVCAAIACMQMAVAPAIQLGMRLFRRNKRMWSGCFSPHTEACFQ